MSQATAVVLDKDEHERDDIRMRLSHCGIVPICFQDEWICLENIFHIKPCFAVVHTDSTVSATRFVNMAKAIDNRFPVVVLSNAGERERFVPCSDLENLFCLPYPTDDQEFRGTIERLQSGPKARGAMLVAGSSVRRTLLNKVPRIAVSREPVLIQGERGVGKKRLAKEIYRWSTTGADRLDRIAADRVNRAWIESVSPLESTPRTLIIEDVERLTPIIQAQLLPLVEDAAGWVHDTGAVGVRIISLTRQDLWLMVRQGHFREDLYHRLSVFKIDVPPLRHHPNDIRILAEYFAVQFGVILKGGLCKLPRAAMKAFLAYDWPGNVAELKRCVKNYMKTQSVCINEKKSELCVLDRPIDGSAAAWIPNIADVKRFLNGYEETSLKQARSTYVTWIEKKMLNAALEKTGGNCKKAASLLGISYKSMLNKVKMYQLV